MSALWLLSGAILGILGGYYGRRLFAADLKPEVDVIDVVSIAVNVMLAILLTRVIEKRQSDDRVEKDLLIGTAKDVKGQGELIRLHVREYADSDAPAEKPTVFLRRMKKLLEAAEDLSEVVRLCHGDKAAHKIGQIVSLASEYHRASTRNFPFKRMTPAEFRDSDNVASQLIAALRSTIIAINRR